jgi:hypothetical protein
MQTYTAQRSNSAQVPLQIASPWLRSSLFPPSVAWRFALNSLSQLITGLLDGCRSMEDAEGLMHPTHACQWFLGSVV